MKSRFNKGRGRSHGTGGIKPVLNFVQAENIRARVAAGESQASLGRKYGVSRQEICNIVAGLRFGYDLEKDREERAMDVAWRRYEVALERYNEWIAKRKAEIQDVETNPSLSIGEISTCVRRKLSTVSDRNSGQNSPSYAV